MIEGCSGINIEMLADLPYRRGIASLFDKSPNKIEDLSLPGCQLHLHPLNPDCKLDPFSVLNPKLETLNSKQTQMAKAQKSKLPFEFRI